ncbi:PREDICTED: probable cyclin-dependent serine/threonine-protein kinase DDB_G0292550 [Polistes dominula]|uniref:Probable cyclin-dependent serine/threonine-protein kinase DDB_G0292550 n=1 Tax=Polistes dominula TaxID=743375 RepID=A0ABM1J919_POLDO|nr:PREDICTED: probable cyclin-dependent serine/threonine-protein kinase DDB_G0292550 [Polistes dominula]
MSCLDDKTALRLNIKVNSENLLPVPQKYNVGSLRLPEDPSWPKIPQRKLVDNADDIIHPPYIITLTGTPRKSRSTVRTPQCQSFKTMEMKDLNFSVYQKPLNTMKRKPSSLDPRFKRVTTVKNQTIPTQSNKQYNNSKESQQTTSILEKSQLPCETTKKAASEKNLNIQQIIQENTKKPENEEVIKYNNNNFKQELLNGELLQKSNAEDNNTLECKANIAKDHNTNNLININSTSIIDSVDIKENIDPSSENNKNIIEKEISMGEQISTSICNEKQILETKTNNDLKGLPGNQSLQSANESDGPILLVMKKKVHPLPVDKIYATQCYNVQVPVITYQNVPLKISTYQSGEINISPCIASTLPISDLCTTTQFQVKDTNVHTSSYEKQNLDNLQKKNEVVDTGKNDTIHIRDKQKNLILENKTEDRFSEQSTVEENYYDTSSLPNNNKILISASNNNTYNCSNDYLKVISHQRPTENNDSGAYTSIKISNLKKYNFSKQRKMKSEENLSLKKNTYSKKLFQSSEPHITSRRKRIRANFSKRARSYFQKKSKSRVVNSNCTLTQSSYQQTNYKYDPRFLKIEQYTKDKNCHFLMLKKPIHERNKDKNMDCIKMESSVENPTISSNVFCQQNKENKYNSLERLDKNNSIENPVRIPLKTQELLNKSYLEYYNKLKQNSGNMENVRQKYFHKVALDAPYVKKRKSKLFYNNIYNDRTKFNPEIQTIEQCSALSSIINKNL